MSASVYTRLPSKFDFTSYYLQQAGGAPTAFPIYRARQRGGFLAPLLKKHGIPFLKWIGKQAASLASGIGNQYLEQGTLSKADLKKALKQQGKKTARSALDSLKQQVGAGGGGASMNFRRDARLSSLIPTHTQQRRGTISQLYGVRPPFSSEQNWEHNSFSASPDRKTRRKPRKKQTVKRKSAKSTKTKAGRGHNKKATKKKKKNKTKKSGEKKKKGESSKKAKESLNHLKHTIFS